MVILKDLVNEVRRNVGYYINPGVGAKGWVIEKWQQGLGLVTGKPTLSAYQENLVLEEATRSAGVWPVTWESTRGLYSNLLFDELTARPIHNAFQAGMQAYLEKKIGEKTSTSEAVKYAKAKMAGR